MEGVWACLQWSYILLDLVKELNLIPTCSFSYYTRGGNFVRTFLPEDCIDQHRHMMYLEPKCTNYLNPKQKCDFWFSFSSDEKPQTFCRIIPNIQTNFSVPLHMFQSYIITRTLRSTPLPKKSVVHVAAGSVFLLRVACGAGAFLRNQSLRWRWTAP